MSDLKVVRLGEQDAARWDVFVRTSPHGSFYQEWFWLNLLTKHMPGQEIRVYGCLDGEELVGGCSFRVDRKLGLKIATRPWATHYYGIITADGGPQREAAVTQALLKQLVREYNVLQMVHAAAFHCSEPYRERGFEIKERRTLVFMTDTEEAMWKHVTKDARNASRRALKEGVRVSRSTDVGTFCRLYWSTYERQGIDINFKPAEFEVLCGEIISADRGGLWMAADEKGTPCAGVLMGWDEKRAYGLFSGNDGRFSRNGSGTLVWWEIFMALAPRFREVDMVGEGTATTPGIKRFKMQFNPVETPLMETNSYGSVLDSLRWRLLQRLRAAKGKLAARREKAAAGGGADQPGGR